MYLSPALVAGFAVSTSAFLVPLEISKAAEDAKSGLASLFGSHGYALDLECPACPFFDGTEPQSGVENKIHLEFAVDHERRLTVNGRSVLPTDATNDDAPSVVTAPQIRVEDGQQTKPVDLDFAWERLPPVTSEEEKDNVILPIRFTILGLQGYPVKVDTVSLDLVQSPHQTSIARVTTIPFAETPGANTCDPAFKWSLCRVRSIIAARLQALMETAKAHASTAKGWIGGEGKPEGKGCGRKYGMFAPKGFGMGGPPGHHGHHGHHGYRFRAHRLGHMLHQTLRFLVIPALLGVIGGLLASAIGMLVGQLIAYVWIRYRRNGRRGSASDIRVVELVIDDEEKDALIVDETEVPPPPEYRDVETGEDDKDY